MLTDSSNTFSVLFAVVRPRALSSSDRLVASMLSLAKSPANATLKVLLPSLGMTFTTKPSALVSAEMPLVDITISSTDAELSW